MHCKYLPYLQEGKFCPRTITISISISTGMIRKGLRLRVELRLVVPIDLIIRGIVSVSNNQPAHKLKLNPRLSNHLGSRSAASRVQLLETAAEILQQHQEKFSAV